MQRARKVYSSLVELMERSGAGWANTPLSINTAMKLLLLAKNRVPLKPIVRIRIIDVLDPVRKAGM